MVSGEDPGLADECSSSLWRGSRGRSSATRAPSRHSFSLSLGLTNGDLFTHVLSFSPGFRVPAAQRGRPRVYVSHGTRDAVLPISRCSRRLVPLLRSEGYEVLYHEFDGPHAVPPDIAEEAVGWLVGGPALEGH